MTQQDTLSTAQTAPRETASQVPAHAHGGYHTPREIISWLPSTATPWQQDSAIRAHYQYQRIDWAKRPNPMRTPRTRADAVSGFSLRRPMYHDKSLVQPDSIYRPEYAVYHQGVSGDPVPYNIANDNLITSILLGSFILTAVSIAESGHFIQRQFKNFFRVQREGTTVITETGSEWHFQLFLVLQACLLLALVFFFYTKTLGNGVSTLPNYLVIGIYTGIIATYFIVKNLLYTLTGWVFFDKKKNEQWTKSHLFLIAFEGIALFPIVMLLAYFNFSIESTVVYTIFVIVLAKVLSLYKIFNIFFKRNADIVQSFLYFCALEIMPLGILWAVLVFMNYYLKVNF